MDPSSSQGPRRHHIKANYPPPGFSLSPLHGNTERSGKLQGEKAKLKHEAKAFKVRESSEQMVLGLGLMLDKFVGMHKRALIGRFEYLKMSGPELKLWIQEHWKPLIGYLPRFSLLLRGWICFHLLSEEDVGFLLSIFWPI